VNDAFGTQGPARFADMSSKPPPFFRPWLDIEQKRFKARRKIGGVEYAVISDSADDWRALELGGEYKSAAELDMLGAD